MLRAHHWVNPRGHLRQEWRETVYMRFLIKKVDYFAPGLRFPEHLPPIPPWNAARLKASRPRLRSRIRRGRNENHRGQSRRAYEIHRQELPLSLLQLHRGRDMPAQSHKADLRPARVRRRTAMSARLPEAQYKGVWLRQGQVSGSESDNQETKSAIT